MSGVLPRRVQPLRQRRLTVKVQDAEVATKGVGDQKLLGKKNVGYKKSKAKKEEVKEREKKKLTYTSRCLIMIFAIVMANLSLSFFFLPGFYDHTGE